MTRGQVHRVSDDRAHPPRHPGRALLRALLRERNQYPDRAEDVDRRLCDAFQKRVAVLALDMCGFSRLTIRHGIISYLSMIAQMEEVATPAVRNNGGAVFKQEADNLFALFDTPAAALEGALDVFLGFDAANSVLPADRDIYGSVGIGYGDLLVIGAEDVYGHEMNLACRLGEDLACKGEILLTPAAAAALPAGKYELSPVTYDAREGGVIECFRFLRRSPETEAASGAR